MLGSSSREGLAKHNRPWLSLFWVWWRRVCCVSQSGVAVSTWRMAGVGFMWPSTTANRPFVDFNAIQGITGKTNRQGRLKKLKRPRSCHMP